MPANAKYLNPSGFSKFSKITAGILGGYAVTMSLHLALAAWMKHTNVIISATFTGFLLWVGFMILAFYAKKAWKIWVLYLALTLVFSLITWLGILSNPHYMVL